jgi:murein DD-endopeptidase MepM/ murein hydrolase activator NlpD
MPITYTLLQNPCPTAWESSGFGYRSFDNSFHQGLDMATGMGTPYYAAESGTVIYATNDGGWNGGAGNWVVIAHGNGLVTKYMHSQRTLVQPGQQVVRGQHIGDVGETGEAYGAHLHFQVEIDGRAVNPLNYIY